MEPRGDWVCNSKKCQIDGLAPVYELPIAATRCAVCGSKRIKRLYLTAPGVLRSGSRQLQRVIDDVGSEAQGKQDKVRDAELRMTKMHSEIQGPKPAAPMFAVPLKQLAGTLKSLGLSTTVNTGLINSNDKSLPMTRPSEPLIAELARGGVKTQVALRDKARIKNGKVEEAP